MLLSLIGLRASSQGTTNILYERKKVDDIAKNFKYTMTLPRGYKNITLIGGHREIENQYVYPDSIKVYISDFPISILNYNNIHSLGDSIANIRSQSLDLNSKIAKVLGKEYNPETLILEGKTRNGLYWKDVRVGYLSIGYVNVPEIKRLDFEKFLNSFKIVN